MSVVYINPLLSSPSFFVTTFFASKIPKGENHSLWLSSLGYTSNPLMHHVSYLLPSTENARVEQHMCRSRKKNTMEKGMLGLLPVLPSSTKRRSKPSMVGRSGGGEFYKKDFESSTMLRSRDTVETRMEHFDVCLLEILVLRPRNRSER
jgi:hypothetical protein